LINIHTNNYWTSSELDKPDDFIIGKYDGLNLFDRNPATAWVEGEKDAGIGQYIMIGVGKNLPRKIFINNGYQKSRDPFYKNDRLKSATISLYVGISLPGHETQLGPQFEAMKYGKELSLEFPDSMKTLSFDITWNPEEINDFKGMVKDQFIKQHLNEMKEGESNLELQIIFKFTITGIYNGTKWNDTCISDLWFDRGHNNPTSGLRSDESVINIYTSDDERVVYVKTNKRDKIVLADVRKDSLPGDEFITVSILDTSPDKQWVQIDFMHGYRSGGDVEETPWLFNVGLLRKVNKTLIGEDIFTYYGFEVKNGKTWLDTDAGLIDLDEVFKKMVGNE